MPDPALYISATQIAARSGLHHMTVWKRLKADPTFPKPYKFSSRCTRWRLSDIESWERDKQLKN
jgi:prophage regulatory protein